MKIIHALIAIAIATLFTATFTFAHGEDEGMEEQSIKLIVMAAGERVEIDGSDMEVGDSRQFLTDEGKEVIISREEDGYSVTIDGEEIEIGGNHLNGLLHGEHGEHGDHRKIMIKHLGGHGDGDVRVIGSDGEMDVVVDREIEWHGADGGHKVIVMDRGDFKSPAQHLLDSGVLDRVDEETREEILQVLRDAAPHPARAHRIFIEENHGEEEAGDDI